MSHVRGHSVCVVDQKVKIVASPKIPKAADASKHKAGGGNVQICQYNHISYQPTVHRAMPLAIKLTHFTLRLGCVGCCECSRREGESGGVCQDTAGQGCSQAQGRRRQRGDLYGRHEQPTSVALHDPLLAPVHSLTHPHCCVDTVNEKLDFAGKAQAKVPSARISSSPTSKDGSRRASLTHDDSLNKTVTDDDLNTTAA